MATHWRFLKLTSAHGPWHMAVDEAIMILHGQGRVPPTLRFYMWRPQCLSIGYFQSARKDINTEACASQGIDLVRRQTGGRALLHDNELTYSLIASERESSVSGSVTDSFKKISVGIVEGFRILGVDAEIGAQRAEGGGRWRSPACFDSASHHEITFKGKKVVGSAQCRKGGVILQQGSIPLSLDVGKLFSLLRLPAGKALGHAESRFRERVLPLAEALGREVRVGEVAQALLQGLETALGVSMVAGELTREEEALARSRALQKYGNPDWNLRR